MGYRLANELSPADVGRRVSVRMRVDHKRMTDVVGVLEAWEGGRLRIRRRDGEIRYVDESKLIASKVVPPAPPRRPEAD